MGRGLGELRFRKFISRQRLRSMASTTTTSFRIASAFRGGPIRWLILGGALLIAAIAIGATFMAGNFRERALRNSERELENTVLLLARHFDQQFEDFQVVQKDLIAFMRSSGIATVENYKRRMSCHDIHLMLKSKIDALSYVGGINVFDADGNLINASAGLAGATGQLGGPRLFQDLQVQPAIAGDAGRAGLQPRHRRLDHGDRAQGYRAERRIRRRHRPRHRTRQLRKILRNRSARTRRHHRHAPQRRHAARPLPACGGVDRQELQGRSGRPAADIRAAAQHVAPHQPDRRRGPAGLVARADEFSACDHRFDHDIGRTGRLARADRNPDHDQRTFGAGDRRPAVSCRPQAFAPAPRVASSGCRWKSSVSTPPSTT